MTSKFRTQFLCTYQNTLLGTFFVFRPKIQCISTYIVGYGNHVTPKCIEFLVSTFNF